MQSEGVYVFTHADIFDQDFIYLPIKYVEASL